MKKNKDVPDQESAPKVQVRADAPRRAALTRILAGGAVAVAAAPAQWARPVVESVVLPAHAQTSNIPDGEFGLQLPSSESGWIDWLVPRAYALISCGPVSGCATLQNGIVTLSVNFLDNDKKEVGCYSGSAAIGGSFNLALVAGTEDELECPNVAGESVSILGIAGDAPDRTIEIDMLGDTLTLTEGYSGTCQCGELPA